MPRKNRYTSPMAGRPPTVIPLVEDQPRLARGALRRAGALSPGVVTEWRWEGSALGLIITTVGFRGGFMLRHGADEITVLTRPKRLVCPACAGLCKYLLHYGERWTCQSCSGCDWQSRHRFRSEPFCRWRSTLRRLSRVPVLSQRGAELRRQLREADRQIARKLERRYGGKGQV
jgi:hypothetical protein